MGLVELKSEGVTYNLLVEDCDAQTIKILYGQENDKSVVLVENNNRVLRMQNNGKFPVVADSNYRVIFGHNQASSKKT